MMTTDLLTTAAKQALEAEGCERLKEWAAIGPVQRAAVESFLAAALAQHEQAEPVEIGQEWQPCVKLPVTVHVREQRPGESHVSTREGITPIRTDDLIMRGVAGEEYPIGRELFQRTYRLGTHPPRREWQGLKEEKCLKAMQLEGDEK